MSNQNGKFLRQHEEANSRGFRLESPSSNRKFHFSQPRGNPTQGDLFRQISPSNRGSSAFKSPYLSPRNSTSDFFNALTQHMRRIDENFSIQLSDETPLQQALNAIIYAVNVIEETYQKSNFSIPEDPEILTKSSRLQQLDQMLKLKEEKLKHEESILLKEKALVSAEKEKIRKLKEHYAELEAELKAQKASLDAKEKEENLKLLKIREKLEKQFNDLEEEKQKNDQETHELESLKNKLIEFNANLSAEKEELEEDRNVIFEKTLELEREKWKIENEKALVEEKEMINNHLKEKIDAELLQIETERSSLLRAKIEFESEISKRDHYKFTDAEKLSFQDAQNLLQTEKLSLAQEREKLTLEEERIAQILMEIEEEKHKIVQERIALEQEKQAVSEEKEAVDEAWNDVELNQGCQTGSKRPKQEDYTQLLEDLQKQMIEYNKEVEIRERDIELKTNELVQKEAEIEKKMIEIQNVEYTLLKARQDLEELSLGTIPELEVQSQRVQKILADMLVKRGASESRGEMNRSKNGRSSADVIKLADELEYKLKKLRQREDELMSIQAALEAEKKENLAHAIFLQNARKEFEVRCSVKEAELSEEKAKIERAKKELKIF